ncbi:MAG: dTDP-glucose 4,6-dehydratase [Desulfurispora sp.]|uniref:dTDP-glucose 4,6-dehydratase n=1 Tax=Desulfurispora sp. TaxID=3014275 RepID=UPI00404B3CEF
MNILVTGGCGFIGANFLNMYVSLYPEHNFINLDKLTYAANPFSLQSIARRPNYHFVHADLADYDRVEEVFSRYDPQVVIHFAAESHVDRSIVGPAPFIQSNIMGTFHLLEACRQFWAEKTDRVFHHISTDEVYGSRLEGYCQEGSPYDPSSPYAASKAASDHLVRAYHRTYGLPVKITNCTNNYGPYQFPEKLIPLMILNAINGRPLPVYGTGENVRDWIYVEDHCRAIWLVMQKGRPGETYNVGSGRGHTNMEVVRMICEILAEETGRPAGEYKQMITFVQDRPGHDWRYAVDTCKIKTELGWQPRESLSTGLRKTVRWYLNNRAWVETVVSGEYQKWLEQNYAFRFQLSGTLCAK